MELRTTAHRLRPACRPDAESLRACNAGAASLAPWRSLHSTPVGAPPGAVSCPCRAHSAYADPAAEKAKVYALPLYAESAPCNRKSYPACMRGGQSANTLQTHCKQQAPESPPQTIPGNRAEVGKMPALKGFRRCPSAHQMRQLTSCADRDRLAAAISRNMG